MQVYANGADNGLAASSNIISFKPDATVKIWTENSAEKDYRPYIPYVWEYDESIGEYRWFVAVPYVYDDGTWKICT